jgi:SAM-dependent methyltransferase
LAAATSRVNLLIHTLPALSGSIRSASTTMASFRDLFAFASGSYASHRPAYPTALFRWLASVSSRRERAWDCGTGSGQAAVSLAEEFSQVAATDASVTQLESAHQAQGVHYLAAAAEAAPLATRSVDLVTVAQALHWFDRARFFAEVDRVLRPGGHLAVWSYGMITIAPPIDAVLHRFYEEVLGPFWPAERALVESGYAGIVLPYPEDPTPSFEMETTWQLAQLGGYLSTWSAVGRFRAARGTDPMPAVLHELEGVWGADAPKKIRWPLVVRLARKPM